MHLAESREELEWIHSNSGPFREILGEAGAARSREGQRSSILDYLELLAGASRALVVHGNYLTDEELDFIAARAATMAVVYCPRTHAFFGHQPYPLARMLEMGVPVALGTDSRASNPDLSVLAEMQFVAAHHPDVSAANSAGAGYPGRRKSAGARRNRGNAPTRQARQSGRHSIERRQRARPARATAGPHGRSNPDLAARPANFLNPATPQAIR